jgi:hypothetical protein
MIQYLDRNQWPLVFIRGSTAFHSLKFECSCGVRVQVERGRQPPAHVFGIEFECLELAGRGYFFFPTPRLSI